MQVLTGITGFEVADQGLSPLLQVEDDETKSYSRLISVTRAASGGTVGAVLKNTAGTGAARLQLDANASGGLAQLEVASAGGCTLYAPNQEIWLRTSGAAPLVIETDSDVTVNYGLNYLSDSRVKENVRDADLGELQAIFDAAVPKRYDRTDVAHKDWLGFLAQHFEAPKDASRRSKAHDPRIKDVDGGPSWTLARSEWQPWKSRKARLSLGPRSNPSIDRGGDLPAQVWRNAVQLALACGSSARFFPCSGCCPSAPPQGDGPAPWTAAKSADRSLGHPVQVSLR